MATKRFKAAVVQDDKTSGCGIPLPFNPKDVFGKVRAPVVAKIGRHTYRTTTCSMGGTFWIPLSRINREAAGVTAGDEVTVTLAADNASRVVTVPDDFAAALKKYKSAATAWAQLSYTHQREHVEAITGASAETRTRRIQAAISKLAGG